MGLRLEEDHFGSRVILELITHLPSHGNDWVTGLARVKLNHWLIEDAAAHHPHIFNHLCKKPMSAEQLLELQVNKQISFNQPKCVAGLSSTKLPQKAKKFTERFFLQLDEASNAEFLLEFEGTDVSQNIVEHLAHDLRVQGHLKMIGNPQKLKVHYEHRGSHYTFQHDFRYECRLALGPCVKGKCLDNEPVWLKFEPISQVVA